MTNASNEKPPVCGALSLKKAPIDESLLDKMDDAYRKFFWNKGKFLVCPPIFLKDGLWYQDDSKYQDRDIFPTLGMFGFYDPDGPFVKISRLLFQPSLAIYLVQMCLDYFKAEMEKDFEGIVPCPDDCMYHAQGRSLRWIAKAHKDKVIRCVDDFWTWEGCNETQLL